MKRSTKNNEDVGQYERSVPLSQDPDMIRLKELVRQLDPKRREQLMTELEDAAEKEGEEHANTY
ncbi:MAG: hypothetical protein V1792_07325 [Pseudomonadota bacterium]